MQAAFALPSALPTCAGRAPRPATCCVAQPPGPQAPSPREGGPLPDTDRAYINKVRAKLLKTDPDAGPDTGALPDDLDALDDILYDRGPLDEDKVRLFGGWLDEGVAGRKAGRVAPGAPALSEGDERAQFAVASHHRISLSRDEAERQAAEAYNAAMVAFNKGQYKDAVAMYAQAVELVGVPSRLGGQYRLWHAQALDALGEKGRAAEMLESLRNHADADVRKVSRELLFIMTAPALELEPGTFLDIPAFDEEPVVTKNMPVLTSNFGPLRTALVEKEPEPHTLEWYMKKERPPKVKDNTGVEAVLVAAAIGFTLAFMLFSHPA